MAKIKYTCKWKADCFTSVFLAIFLFSSFSTFVLDSGSKSAVFFLQWYTMLYCIHCNTLYYNDMFYTMVYCNDSEVWGTMEPITLVVSIVPNR